MEVNEIQIQNQKKKACAITFRDIFKVLMENGGFSETNPSRSRGTAKAQVWR